MVEPEEAEKAFLMILEEIYDDPLFASQFKAWKNPAYCQAYFSTALYAYGKNMSLTRRYIRKALGVYPQVILHKEGTRLIYNYLTTFIPIRLLSNLRNIKRNLIGNPVWLKE